MKAMDVIDRVDLMEPNAYSPEQKLRWLTALDGRIFLEDICTHEVKCAPHCLPDYQTGDEELLIDAPYGEDIYYNYLQAMIAAENSENTRYNKRMALYNSAYTAWQNYFNRTHMPKSCGPFVF